MSRTANATIIALYAAAIPLLAGLSDETVSRFASLAGFDLGDTYAEATPISDEHAIQLALASTRANHKPVPLTRFAPFIDAEVDETVTVMASLN